MNAHINLDLGIAAAQTSPGRDLPGLQHDFREISRLLGEMLDDVQDRIARVSPWMGVLDRIGMRTDEEICTFCLGGSRDLAWKSAQCFASVDSARLPHEINALDHVVAGLAMPIRTPGIFLRPALTAIRLREPRDVAPVLDAMDVRTEVRKCGSAEVRRVSRPRCHSEGAPARNLNGQRCCGATEESGRY